MEKIDMISIKINTGHYNEFVQDILTSVATKKSAYACIANVHTLIEAYRSKSFGDDIKNANFITPDGKPITWAMKLLYGIQQDRVAGMDLLPDLIRGAEEKHLSVYFYGGTEAIINKTKDYMHKNYPQLVIAGAYNPPFRKLTFEEEQKAIDDINNSGANFLFVVLGCPKQEKWMAAMKNRINSFMIGVGGALPVMIGLQKRAPRWMQNAGLEWFYRLVQEPKRLFKRYAVTNSIFVWLLIKEYLTAKWMHTLHKHPVS